MKKRAFWAVIIFAIFAGGCGEPNTSIPRQKQISITRLSSCSEMYGVFALLNNPEDLYNSEKAV
jgi:hypothetical protein